MPLTDPDERREYERDYIKKRREEDPELRERERLLKAAWYQKNKKKKAEAQRAYRQRKREQALLAETAKLKKKKS